MIIRYHTALYKAYDAVGKPLYIGIASDWAKRWCQHRYHNPWYFDVVRLEVEWFSNRAEALMAEREAIIMEQPKWNWLHTRRSSEMANATGS